MDTIKYRFIQIEKSAITRAEGKGGMVKVAFSSETPVLRIGDGMDHAKGEPYYEVLDHSDRSNADLSLIQNRGAVLDEHDPKSPIGMVMSAEINTEDKMGRAELMMDAAGLGCERCRMMEDGIRPHISVGYDQTRMLSETTHADGKPVKRFAWRAHEISSVAVPADGAVGVGRNLPQFDFRTLSDEQKNQLKKFMAEETQTNWTQVDDNKIRSEAATAAKADAEKAFKARAKEIAAIADALETDYGSKIDETGKSMRDQIRKMANEATQGDESIDSFKNRCLVEVLKAKPAKPISMRSIGVSEKDQQHYSILRGIQSAAKNRMKGNEGIPDENTLEGELHRAIIKANGADGLGYDATGFQVPFDAKLRAGQASLTRDMQATIFNQGGAFVPTELVVPPIEILRNMEVLSQLGVRQMAGLQGNIVIPRQDAAATAYSVSEIGALTASGQILGQIGLSPKRVGATQTYSKQFVFQSTPDAEAFLRDDLFKVIALRRDLLGINGQGANDEPLGVLNTPGVQSIAFGATPTYKQIVQMETNILSANVVGPLAYVSTPATRGSLKTVAVALTGATTIGGAQNAIWVNSEMNGYPAIASNQIPNNQVVLGQWSDMISASWNGFDVVVDYVTKAGNAEIVITINIWCDFALRHPQAFCASSDSGAQ